jgi:hypothetical protein
MDGTSMSGPNVAGSVNLIRRQYELANGAQPRSATLKAIVIHTADEAGANAGPDYQNGWGLMNTAAAATLVASDLAVAQIIEATLAQGETDQYDFTFETDAEFVRATIVWTDPAGTPPATAVDPAALMLVNDLDIRLSRVGTGTTFQPWVLSPGTPSAAATTGDNTRDNVEQIHVADVEAATYRVAVTHKGTLAAAPQAYSLVISVGNQAPVADAGPDQTVECAGGVTEVTLDGTGSSDPDGDTLTYSWSAPGVVFDDPTSATPTGQFPLGTTTVTLTVDDGNGGVDSDTVDITIEDTTPPTIVVVLSRDVLWPPNHKLSTIEATVTVTDVCDPNPTFVLTSITSDEPDNGSGDGDTPNDIQGAAFGTPDVQFLLRSERAGPLDGRTYSITYTAMDESGVTASTTVFVNVPHNRSGFALPANGFLPSGVGIAPGIASYYVVIPARADHPESSPADIRDLDPKRAFVGNHRGEIGSLSRRISDVTGDGLDDLVLEYPAQATRDLVQASSAEAEAVGFRFEDRARVGHWIPNVFALGAPLSLPASGRGSAAIAQDHRADPAAPSAASVPVRTGLTGIHPNPFNPSTAVTFDLAREGTVKVAVYDLRGVLVQTLMDENRSAGPHVVTWNGRDAAGRSVAAGVYLFTFDAAGVRQARKAVLVK